MGPPLTMLPGPMWTMDVGARAIIVVSLYDSVPRIAKKGCRAG
jgi:hypothetical protein